MPAQDDLGVFAVRLYKADIYLTGSDPLHPLRRRLRWSESLDIAMAPPEYVVLRKLEFYREGRSTKHPADIRAIREVTGVDEAVLNPWLERMGLNPLWQEITATA